MLPYSTNQRFSRLKLAITQQCCSWDKIKDTTTIRYVFHPEKAKPIDIVLYEMIGKIDDEIIENSKEFMQIFNIRYLILGL